ncbi:MAG: ABC-type branched-chain amino acid transport system, permease component, partial [Modestobacter sp.]|nr:ABC-type branched-chain amino acid transport system, permease component [Modestobacter sp.]
MSDLQTQGQPPAGNPATAAAPASTSSRTSRIPLPESTLLRHLLAVLVCAVAAVVLLEITDPFRNSQLATLSYYAIAAGGLTVLTGLNGQISLGHG